MKCVKQGCGGNINAMTGKCVKCGAKPDRDRDDSDNTFNAGVVPGPADSSYLDVSPSDTSSSSDSGSSGGDGGGGGGE